MRPSVSRWCGGIGQINYDSKVPAVFGILTCDTLEEAVDRAGAKRATQELMLPLPRWKWQAYSTRFKQNCDDTEIGDVFYIRGRCVDPRTRARQLAMQALCQLDVQGAALFADLNDFFKENSPEDSVCKLASQWTKGTWDNVAACDELIIAAALKWKLSRLSMVDRGILRLAVYQLKFCSDIPPKVAINEAIEMAKIFGSDKSPSFVNGVLDGVLRKLQNDKQQGTAQ